MIIKVQNSKITKIVAIFLLVSFLMEISRPVALFALTGGPSQPEMAGFTPVNTNEMVDLFSGDFHYTIAVMTVPGPNGGYPINLNYNSGSGMDQEASWVGLGWNLNPGAINRQVRGIPDDFNGVQDAITKTYKRRNNTTFVFSPGFGAEVAGADFGVGLNMSQSLIYNTYQGISLSSNFGIAASYIRDREISKDNTVDAKGYKAATVGGSINFDSDNGITPSFSMSGGTKNLSYGAKFGFNSKSGVYTFGTNLSLNYSRTIDRQGNALGYSQSVGTSFTTAAVLPPIHIPMERTSFGVSGQIGGEASILEGYGSISANIAVERTPSNSILTPAYGFIYAENAVAGSLQDFNREKELSVNQNSLNLPLPVMTPDIYTIAGETMGGSFRAYRSGIGYIADNEIRTTDNTFNIGADAGFGYGFQIGVNISDNVSNSVSGPWADSYDKAKLKYKGKESYENSQNKNIHPVLYEPFYFKMSGEQTAAKTNYLDYIGGDKPVAYTLKAITGPSGFSLMQSQYSLENNLKSKSGANTPIQKTVQAQRNKRTRLVEYRTNSELGTASATKQGHHIGEISILNENGERYTYGKALYNNLEEEVSFSLPRQDLPESLNSSTTTQYQQAHASGNTRVGKEKLYSSTTTPAYAYSYLITSITSPDYVDMDGNGPSDNDLGYWVKFSYKNAYSNYKWRFPYNGANLSLGDPSNRTDDIGSYHYGTKEIQYIDSIQTKTHVAVFYTSPRRDGYESGNEYLGGRGTRSLHKLDSIRLYCKTDLQHPIKTAVFEYSYNLCQGVHNNIDNKGKLTLTTVYFKYGSSEKGEETPYRFAYSTHNPSYNPVKMDRWGNYKGNGNYYEHYVSQNKTNADNWSGAWCLSQITLPSGGTIEVEYESDDYAYVQDKPALQMATLNPMTSFEKEGGAYYIYFNKGSGIPASDYVTGFKGNMMFFKMAAAVEKNATIYDYVQGYIKIKPQTASDVSGTIGKVEVEAFEAYNKVHPIYFLCCQYLKNNRPDILFNLDDIGDNASDAKSFFTAIVSRGIVGKANSVYNNNEFYNFCKREKYFTNIIPDNSAMPSYVRLNVPGKVKYGGGDRVKRITLHDHWEKSEASAYTQEYVYRTMENGKLISSGVAEYEPQVCGEETALRYPVYDEVKGFFFKENDIYSEEPYGESYFPAANVGYSKVIVKTAVPDNVKLAASGIQVQEFYTAKDFPVSVSQTALVKNSNPLPNVLRILTGGFKQVSASAFSQGYRIELNDMHGKPKRIATYPYQQSADDDTLLTYLQGAGAVTEVSYYYKTKNGKLDNLVDVLTADNVKEKQILGQTYDFTTDLRENYSISRGFGISANFGFPTPPIPSFYITPFPSFDCFEETVRSVATTKVIYNTGILERIVANNNGSIITTCNLQWDPYTGQPLLTTVTNDFEQPVYNYSMPAYWSYPNLGAASDNYRAYYKKGWNYDTLTCAFDRYDLASIAGNRRTIESIVRQNTNYMQIKGWDENGNLPTNYQNPSFVEILRSRNSNQLSATAASTVSLSDPLAERFFPLFETFNKLAKDECFTYADCNESKQCARIAYYQGRFYFIKFPDCSKNYDIEKMICHPAIPLIQDMINYGYQYYLVSPAVNITLPASGIIGLEFKKTGKNIYIYNRATHQQLASFEWKDPKNLFRECMEDVLQASAAEYHPRWNFDYTDAGITPISSGKENYLGIPNCYRSFRSNLFVTDRKQEGAAATYESNAAHDGIFNFFAFFNHDAGNAGNLQHPWTWTAEITKYSPFNFEIENKNALGIYSSALYGYGNSLATAVSNNARYYEIGFDGFENDLPFSTSQPRGHLKYNSGEIRSDQSHSGNSSLYTSLLSISAATVPAENATPTGGTLTLVRGKQYVFSCWVRKLAKNYNPGGPGSAYTIAINNGTPLLMEVEDLIEEWQRVEVVFTAPASAEMTLTMKLPGNVWCYYDDIRIMPFNGSMKSYVYNPANARLIAELDENNYATFYNYDEEGILVQIKKETEKGIRTIQTTRQHVKN